MVTAVSAVLAAETIGGENRASFQCVSRSLMFVMQVDGESLPLQFALRHPQRDGVEHLVAGYSKCEQQLFRVHRRSVLWFRQTIRSSLASSYYRVRGHGIDRLNGSCGFHITGVTSRGRPVGELTQPSAVSRHGWRS